SLARLVERAVDGGAAASAHALLEPEAPAEKGADHCCSILGDSMAVRVRYFTDPSCAWSWSTEPKLRRLMVEFGDSLSWTYVMGGLTRDFTNADDGGDASF